MLSLLIPDRFMNSCSQFADGSDLSTFAPYQPTNQPTKHPPIRPLTHSLTLSPSLTHSRSLLSLPVSGSTMFAILHILCTFSPSIQHALPISCTCTYISSALSPFLFLRLPVSSCFSPYLYPTHPFSLSPSLSHFLFRFSSTRKTENADMRIER